LAEIRATAAHASVEQSWLGRILTVVDGIHKHPLDWNEQIFQQIAECVKVINKGKGLHCKQYGFPSANHKLNVRRSL